MFWKNGFLGQALLALVPKPTVQLTAECARTGAARSRLERNGSETQWGQAVPTPESAVNPMASGIAAGGRAGVLDAPGQADQSACDKSGENSPHSTDRVCQRFGVR